VRRLVLVLLPAALVLLLVLLRVFATADAPGAQRCRELGSQAATERCLVEAMLDAGSLTAASGELEGALAADTSLRLACHEAAHEVGERFYDASVDVAAFLGSPSAGVCEWGLVHGLLAGLLADSPSPERVDALLAVCTETGDRGFQQACGDSVGHAIWESEGSFAASVERCLRAGSPIGETCVSGVFMQLYRPVAPSADDGGVWSPPLTRDEVRALCDELPSSRAREACATAAYYAFAPDLGAARDVVLAADEPLAAAVSGFVPVLDAALGFCAGFQDGAEGCAKEVVRYALQMLRYLPADEVEALVCGRDLVAPVSAHCRNAAVALL